MRDYQRRIDTDGFAVVENVISPAEADALRAAVELLSTECGQVRRRGGAYGVRNLLGLLSEVRSLAGSAAVRALVEPILGSGCFAVRGTYFDKLPSANWKVGWHQDRAIAVRARGEAPGFGPWSRKAGVWQVQPPPEVLAEMLAVRIHLDACDAQNGPLRVLPGSHRHGWAEDQLDFWKSSVKEVCCEVPLGGALVMRPLLLHASSAAIEPRHRRVIHLEFAHEELPHGLEWNERVGAVSAVWGATGILPVFCRSGMGLTMP